MSIQFFHQLKATDLGVTFPLNDMSGSKCDRDVCLQPEVADKYIPRLSGVCFCSFLHRFTGAKQTTITSRTPLPWKPSYMIRKPPMATDSLFIQQASFQFAGGVSCSGSGSISCRKIEKETAAGAVKRFPSVSLFVSLWHQSINQSNFYIANMTLQGPFPFYTISNWGNLRKVWKQDRTHP